MHVPPTVVDGPFFCSEQQRILLLTGQIWQTSGYGWVHIKNAESVSLT